MNQEIYKTPLRRLIQEKVSAGALLIVSAVIAIVAVNSPWGEMYEHILSQEMSLGIFGVDIFNHNGQPMTLASLISDALMALFFLSVGLEIKREILIGELSSWRKAMLPVIAACGGMIVPVIVFFLISPEGAAQRGAAIPMATDIAFSLAVLSLLGKRVPISLKIFLTTFAVVDDIAGIIVIALFYSSHLSLSLLFFALVTLVLMYVGGKMGITSKLFYMVGFFIVWCLFLHAGIHPTIAGVLSALTIPARPKLNLSSYIADMRASLKTLPQNQSEVRLLSNSELSTLKNIESISDKAISPLQSLEDNLTSLVNYLILPLFALANAGISFDGFSFSAISGISIAVFLGLVIGKPLGIFSFTWIVIKSKLIKMPEFLNYKMIFGVSLLGGIGFTVSMFLANLSYEMIDPEFLNDAKMGVIAGSIVSGILGYLWLKFCLPKETLPDNIL
ncbi:Na+/H+ antiporter NhaA [Proteiniphilum sp.]|uniref:Na+/H+ antiporter NhaA n=1 Tax=Proteiniphilum sp. TaxID=1926877 RepID=UPI003326CE8B